jgi:hypothetical protein
MSNDSDTQRKDKLLNVLEDVENAAEPLEKKAQTVVGIARNSRDLAKSLSEFISVIPADNSVLSQRDWTELTRNWQSQNDAARNLTQVMTEAVPIYAMRAQVTALSTSSTVMATSAVEFHFPQIGPALQEAAKNMDTILRRDPLMKNIQAAFVRFGLDKSQGTRRSPLDLLKDSQLALEHPAGAESSTVGVLIALREAIDGAIADVLRRCPSPEERTRHFDDKILSIGRRCSKTGILSDYFDELGTSGKKLYATLSETKQISVSRDQLFLLFDAGLLFLQTFLDGIDETKLHP